MLLIVTTRLDRVVHAMRRKNMDCPVKPGNDEGVENLALEARSAANGLDSQRVGTPSELR